MDKKTPIMASLASKHVMIRAKGISGLYPSWSSVDVEKMLDGWNTLFIDIQCNLLSMISSMEGKGMKLLKRVLKELDSDVLKEAWLGAVLDVVENDVGGLSLLNE